MDELIQGIYRLFMGGENSDIAGGIVESNYFFPVCLGMVLISIAIMTVYYYAVNSVRWSKWFHWLILVGIICIINFGIAFSCSFSESGDVLDSVSFGFSNAVLSFVVSFIWSLIIKWGSSACRRTPF
ncbi:MAG: hypothetical protein J5606_03380 [Bacteroidales bacterium]|nr:hypothetical protein [Bacteroidales bacterium]